MSRYYCPFCSSLYQIHRIRSDGVLICGQCGDPLIKKNFINIKKIFAILAVSAFVAPLVLMIILIIQNVTNEKLPKNSETLVFLINK